jgi:hypothetical protein
MLYSGSMVTDLRVIIRSDEEDDDLLTVASDFDLRTVEDEEAEDLGLDPVSMALLVGAALAFGKFIVSVLDRRRGGMRIDLGTVPPSVERSKGVPFGFIVIFTADGKVEIKAADEPKDALERMITEAIKLPATVTAATVKGVLEAAKDK